MEYSSFESGTIKIPGKEWKGLREAVADAFNAHQRALLLHAKRLRKRLLALKAEKGSKALDDSRAVRDVVLELAGGCADADWERVWAAAVCRDEKGKLRLRAPKARDFAEVSRSRCAPEYGCSGFKLSLGKSTKTVTWGVPQDHGALEHARGHPVARALFEKLGTILWVRGTGGVLLGNKGELSPDAYVTQRFGPLGARFTLKRHRTHKLSPGRRQPAARL